MHLYTGFQTFQLLLACFHLFGPAVHELKSWGSKGTGKITQKTKLDALIQLFLTLIKLRCNLHVSDLTYRFGISASSVSQYFITWVHFLYHHLCEISIFPLQEQVTCTLPATFKDCKSTFVIVDATEIYMESPSNMCLQSTTWASYKYRNTGAK